MLIKQQALKNIFTTCFLRVWREDQSNDDYWILIPQQFTRCILRVWRVSELKEDPEYWWLLILQQFTRCILRVWWVSEWRKDPEYWWLLILQQWSSSHYTDPQHSYKTETSTNITSKNKYLQDSVRKKEEIMINRFSFFFLWSEWIKLTKRF